MLMKDKQYQGVSRIKLVLKKGTNKCVLTSFPLVRVGGRTFEVTGELFPYETSDLVSVGLVDKVWNK